LKKFKVVVLYDAVIDYKEALLYYRKISPKVAEKFSSVTDDAIGDLKKNPFYQIRYDEFRMKAIKDFPYIIHYIVNETTSTVSIYGIRNSYGSPDKYPSVK
jgi:toxin ParE1/3/4